MKRILASFSVILLSACAPGSLGRELQMGFATRLDALRTSLSLDVGPLELPRLDELLLRAPSPAPASFLQDELSRLRWLVEDVGQLRIQPPSASFMAASELRRLRLLADSFLELWTGEQQIRQHVAATLIKP